MNKLITTFKNIFRIKELKDKILFTLLLLLIYRVGSLLPLPWVDITALSKLQSDNIVSKFSDSIGLSLTNYSLFSLGVMPYISASIIMQLVSFAIPKFQQMNEEESGRRKINQYTRLLTIGVAIAQSYAYMGYIFKQEVLKPGILLEDVMYLYILLLVAGTMFSMWLGEKITDKGIGNGISLLIAIGIISRLPKALLGELDKSGITGLGFFMLELVGLFFTILLTVAIIQATRRIPLQYARQLAVGSSVVGGPRTYLPFKLTLVGVMPVIFAQTLTIIPQFIGNSLSNVPYLGSFMISLSQTDSLSHNLFLCFLIIIFTYFYTALTVNPTKIADDLKRNNAYIPGVNPGDETVSYIDKVLSLITFPGAVFLCIIAVLPAIVRAIFNLDPDVASFFGGTSLLIMVGVVLDTLQQIESYLLMQKYDGMIEGGRIKGRTENEFVTA
ncbi:MAG TPA: preprotein translocase subunit SecY [Cytophagales bacterium]|nr:preprotein translocase subunit SecY [Cytophagales bacterium]